jgi:hypothetical protein
MFALHPLLLWGFEVGSHKLACVLQAALMGAPSAALVWCTTSIVVDLLQRLWGYRMPLHVTFLVCVQHAGLGAKGGMQKQNLLQLKASGDTWQQKGMAQAPHFLGADGSVSVPPTWGNMLRANRKSDDGPKETGTT